MKIIYVHHALRKKGNPPTQDDKIQPLGIKDAKITAKLIKQIAKKSNICAIYTSPYYRCAKTAEIINKYAKAPIYEEAGLNEFNKTYTIVENGQTITKTETWIECQQRIRQALQEIVNKHQENDTVICVTSGVNIAVFISLAFKIPASETLPFPSVPSCSPIGFEIDKSCF